jgi:hypothetical protein
MITGRLDSLILALSMVHFLVNRYLRRLELIQYFIVMSCLFVYFLLYIKLLIFFLVIFYPLWIIFSKMSLFYLFFRHFLYLLIWTYLSEKHSVIVLLKLILVSFWACDGRLRLNKLLIWFWNLDVSAAIIIFKKQ